MEPKVILLCVALLSGCSTIKDMICEKPLPTEPYDVVLSQEMTSKCEVPTDLLTNSWDAALENHNQLKQLYKVCSKKLEVSQGFIRKLDNVKIIRITTPESKGSVSGAKETR